MSDSKARTCILILLIGVSLFLRTWKLGAVGLSEDESNKILAVESYRRGDFTPNSEHPMLMKALCALSVVAAESLRSLSIPVSPEAALRFPVAVAGAAGTGAVYFLGLELLNPPAALIAAALWATDINAVALTRIAKEDPLVTLFFVLGCAFLLRGKRLHFEDRPRAVRNYVACGASFGLLFASKYLIPIGWIPLIYYDAFRFGREPRWRMDRATNFRIYTAFLVAFLVCNPVLLSPDMWAYAWKHFTYRTATHNGYMMMDLLQPNKAYYTFWGTPAYFFPLYLFVKAPWPQLVFLAMGLVFAVRRVRDSRFFFLTLYFWLWLFLLTLPGGKFTRYIISLLPAVCLLQSLGIYLLYTVIDNHMKKRGASRLLSVFALAAMLAVSAGWQFSLLFKHLPYASMYVSKQGGGESRRGYYFPQDDFYDAGLREAIEWVCRVAPRDGMVIGSAPAAFRYYRNVYGRPDLRFESSFDRSFFPNPADSPYVLYQEYRTYQEDRDLMTFFHGVLIPRHTEEVLGVRSVTVYRLCADVQCARTRFWESDRWTERLRLCRGNPKLQPS